MLTGLNKFPHLNDAGNRDQLCDQFLNLIEICDSFDQLGKLAVILDNLYEPSDREHSPLFKQLENTARHLRGLPALDPLLDRPRCNLCFGPCGKCDLEAQ